MKPPRRERVGVLGGTFDPVHAGHLAMARAAERTCGLARVCFVPAPSPWHRRRPPLASYADRYAMLALALNGRSNWLPLDVPDTPGRPTYTIDQLRWMRQHGWGERLYFIVGADSFATLPQWHRWRELLARCDWVVLGRGAGKRLPDVVPANMITQARQDGLQLRGGTRLHWLPDFAQPVSASSTRQALREGGAGALGVPRAAERQDGVNDAVRRLRAQPRPAPRPTIARKRSAAVPAAVARYIQRAGLYQLHE